MKPEAEIRTPTDNRSTPAPPRPRDCELKQMEQLLDAFFASTGI